MSYMHMKDRILDEYVRAYIETKFVTTHLLYTYTNLAICVVHIILDGGWVASRLR